MPHHYQYGSQPNRCNMGQNRCTQDSHSPSQKCRNHNMVEHAQTVGPGGPVLLQDTILHETLETFVHEKNHRKSCTYERLWSIWILYGLSVYAPLYQSILFTETRSGNLHLFTVFFCREYKRNPGHRPECKGIFHQILYRLRRF